MNVVIVADIDMAEDVKVCVLGYCSEYGWEELDVVPRPLPQKMKRRTTDGAIDLIYATGYNKCLEEITGETE